MSVLWENKGFPPMPGWGGSLFRQTDICCHNTSFKVTPAYGDQTSLLYDSTLPGQHTNQQRRLGARVSSPAIVHWLENSPSMDAPGETTLSEGEKDDSDYKVSSLLLFL